MLSAFILLGAGYQQKTQKEVTLLTTTVKEHQNQIAIESERKVKSEVITQAEQVKVGSTPYRGSWFDIEYPQNFIARPTTPTNVDNTITHIVTDEAYFTSPDEAVDFFVYSPLWSGNPNNYLTIDLTEEVISEKIEKLKKVINLVNLETE